MKVATNCLANMHSLFASNIPVKQGVLTTDLALFLLPQQPPLEHCSLEHQNVSTKMGNFRAKWTQNHLI